MTTLFISDLHLSKQRPHITQLFSGFITSQAKDTEALYILGDLFEVWLGDDMVLPEYQDAISAIKTLTGHNVPVYVMHGNRDFLMRDEFENLSGCQLINDPALIDLYGSKTLLMHGDTLCTDDAAYQKFRTMVRNPDWQADLLAHSPKERLELAQEYREMSRAEIGEKTDAIMDVSQTTVASAMLTHNVTQLIHGHTHRPGIHDFELNNQSARRIVLGDWYQQGSVLVCDKNGCDLQTVR